MSQRVTYTYTITSPILEETRVIKASSQEELQAKVAKVQVTWAQKEQRLLERQAISDQKELAEQQTSDALALIDEYQSLLKATLLVNDQVDWSTHFDRKRFRPAPFNEEPPDLDDVNFDLNVPAASWIEMFWNPSKVKRLTLETQAQEEYAKRVAAFESRKATHKKVSSEAEAEFKRRQKAANDEIHQLRQAYESGDRDAIERYSTMVLERSRYPDAFEGDFSFQFEPNSGTAIVDYQLPSPDQAPRIVQYRFIQSRKVTETVEMKAKDFTAFYDSIVHQVTLRTIHELFEADYPKFFQSVVFNGWVSGVDPATGSDFTACVISCQASREAFEPLDLSRVDPRECLRMLRALIAGPLAQLAPVRPIMQMSQVDNRFVESRDILTSMDSAQNLATMPWEDFEHLVRELFGQVFTTDGGEVKVTRASRDGGVDAIAFDPTPIRGGKYVIQAKRYNNVVPVSAVRDLYGTMINEGAVKGILVTTSYFGHDSREFVKDKPLELIDGSNLVYMFQEHGHNVRIELMKAQGLQP